jgi:ribosomal protein L30E
MAEVLPELMQTGPKKKKKNIKYYAELCKKVHVLVKEVLRIKMHGETVKFEMCLI